MIQSLGEEQNLVKKDQAKIITAIIKKIGITYYY